MLRVNVVTLFPEVFETPLRSSIPGRAAAKGLVEIRVVDLRDYTHDRHRTVDDAPYGGGPGMVLKPEPFFEALDDLSASPPIVLLSARGKLFSHDDAVRFSVADELTLLCGHYKDVDERVARREGTEEIAIGNFVLSGGEFAALCVIDAVVPSVGSGRIPTRAPGRGRARQWRARRRRQRRSSHGQSQASQEEGQEEYSDGRGACPRHVQ